MKGIYNFILILAGLLLQTLIAAIPINFITDCNFLQTWKKIIYFEGGLCLIVFFICASAALLDRKN